jgi:HNH endonuclease
MIDRLPRRIWEKIAVNLDTDCWLWIASVRPTGYGQVHYRGRTCSAHKVVYEALVGPYPQSDLDHLCRVRRCVNPRHLQPVSRKINANRGLNLVWMQLRERTHCPEGHLFSGENLIISWHNNGNGSPVRRCRICRNAYSREWKRQKGIKDGDETK